MSSPFTVDHFFRHEYAGLVASLARRVGVQHIQAVEDAAQCALMRALEHWPMSGEPDNPRAWLFRVAYNELFGELRKEGGRRRLLEEHRDEIERPESMGPSTTMSQELRDDLLRMLFLCCDDRIPSDTRVVLALKTLCGFSVQEIAARLFCSEASVYKRLGRAKERLCELKVEETLDQECMTTRLASVHRVLYLLFTEGYLSSCASLSIREELCDEALRLATLLVGHPLGATPEGCALVALMHLQRSRVGARQSASGGLLLLEEQDRSLWDKEQIRTGLMWLARSAEGEQFSRYHAEAGIAAEHCLAPSFAETRWHRVVECYELLENDAPSALHRLNRAVAVAEWRGAEAGLKLLRDFVPPPWLERSYLWAAVLSDLYRRCGDKGCATRYREEALALSPTDAISELLERRLVVTP